MSFEKLAKNSIRVKPARGGASIIVSSDAAVPKPTSGENGDAAVITLSEQSRLPAGVIVPQSKLKTATLWPEYLAGIGNNFRGPALRSPNDRLRLAVISVQM